MNDKKNKLRDSFQEMKSTIENAEIRLNQFIDKDNKAAGTDVRKYMQDVKQYAQLVRELVQEIKNAQ